MQQRFYDAFQENPIVAAIRSDADLADCLTTDVRVVFVLYGDVCSISDIVDRVKTAGKLAAFCRCNSFGSGVFRTSA